MIRVYQDKVVKYNNSGEMIERGNCFAACIASIMEIPLNHVPNIEELYFIEGHYWHEVLLTWLNAKGWQLCQVNKDFIIKYDDYYFATGKSPRGSFNHIAIYLHGELRHDPYKYGSGILGEPTHYEILERL